MAQGARPVGRGADRQCARSVRRVARLAGGMVFLDPGGWGAFMLRLEATYGSKNKKSKVAQKRPAIRDPRSEIRDPLEGENTPAF